MSIKEVSDIPEPANVKKETLYDLILQDIRYAYENNISTFEFDYSQYSHSSVYSTAQRAAIRWFDEDVLPYAKKEAQEKADEQVEPHVYGFWSDFDSYITITSRKLPDRVHVFCYIDLEKIKNYPDTLLENAYSSWTRSEKVIKEMSLEDAKRLYKVIKDANKKSLSEKETVKKISEFLRKEFEDYYVENY